MVQMITTPHVFAILLGVLAIVTPLGAFFLGPSWRNQRIRIALGASGPVFLGLWGLQFAVLEGLGFASVWAVILLLVIAAGIGAATGVWISAGTSANRKDYPS
jgi:hypothetical protein